MNSDDKNNQTRNRGGAKRRPSASSAGSSHDLEMSWRRLRSAPDGTPVEMDEVARDLRALAFEAEKALGAGPDLLQRLKQHLASLAARAPSAHAARSTDAPPPRSDGAGLPSDPAGRAGRNTATVPSTVAAPPPDGVESTGELLGKTVRAEVKRLLDLERKASIEHASRLESTLQDIRRDIQVARGSTGDLRVQFETVADRLAVLGQRLEDMGSRDASSRERVSGTIQRAADETTLVARAVSELATKIDGRIDLSDAQQVLRLRQDVERLVTAEQIRGISRAIVPALDLLREALAKVDSEGAARALAALVRRCEQAGLIMDQRQLF